MGGVLLKESHDHFETLLGCQIEPHLKWHKHVDNLLSRLQQRLSALENLSSMVPLGIKRKIVEGIFNSVLIYCLPVFGGCTKGEIDSLQKMQNKAARLVVNKGWRTPRKEVFAEVGWMTVKQLIVYHTALCTFRIRESKEPEYLHAFMSQTNRLNRIIIPHTNLSLMRSSYCYRGALEWNNLPDALRSCRSMRKFKSLLKGWIYENIPQFEERR